MAFHDSQPLQTLGYMPLYHADTVNHCPGCGRTHWHVGRQSAECAFCDTALPLAVTYSQPAKPLFWFRGSSTAEVTQRTQ
jgi:hypothetical protein